MKALILTGLDKPLELQERELPELMPDEALVKVHAAALNHRDSWIRQGKYSGITYPITLGSDGAGVVTKVGSDVNGDWLNQEVIIHPGSNWGANEQVMGSDFKILGLPDDGTFAEFVIVKAHNLHAKPKHLSFEQAAALPLSGVTAYRALFSRAEVQKGDKVLINGIGGGVALLVLQYAVAAGCEVYVTSSSEEKIEQAKKLGALGGTNYTKENWAEALKAKTGGFNVIVDSAAGEGFNHLVQLAAPAGRIVFYGATRGMMTEVDPRSIFWKQLSILGSTMGSDADFHQMLAFVEQHQLVPMIDRVFPFSKANDAFSRMENGLQFGKIVLNDM